MKKKRVIVGALAAGALLFGIIGSANNQSQSSSLNTAQPIHTNSAVNDAVKESVPVCDGTTVTANCVLDGVKYTTYIYHPAVSEQFHTETVTTYHQEVSGYCTLCNDGTYSPSCATGRGACSYHGGVAQWNAPRYVNMPEYSTKKVIDTPAQEAYYEKVME